MQRTNEGVTLVEAQKHVHAPLQLGEPHVQTRHAAKVRKHKLDWGPLRTSSQIVAKIHFPNGSCHSFSLLVQKEKFATQMQIGKKDAQHFQIFQRLYNYLVAAIFQQRHTLSRQRNIFFPARCMPMLLHWPDN